jgi:hypothetical protein
MSGAGFIHVFLPRSADKAACARRLLATSLATYGLGVDRWRRVSIAQDLFQVTVTRRVRSLAGDLQQRLDQARKETEERACAYGLDDFHVASPGECAVVSALPAGVPDAPFETPSVHESRTLAVSGGHRMWE